MKRVFTFICTLMLVISAIGPIGTIKVAHAAVGPISLGFKPNDTALDPTRPVVYMTKLGSKTIYAANYETGEVKTLMLPYPAEKLDLYKGNLYVTQQKMSHNHYNFGPYSGAIAEVNTETFTLNGLMDVNADPYDIAISDDGFIYITPGSGQWQNIKVYSLADKTEVPNTTGNAMIYEQSTIFYSSDNSKIYTITSNVSPRDITAMEIRNGVIQAKYDSPYHGDYDLDTEAKITPDGQYMYNNSGNVFGLSAVQSGDMQFNFDLGQTYNDYAFSLDKQLTFGANSNGDIDVFKYNTDEFLYTINENGIVQNLFYKDGLITVYSDDKGKYYLDYINSVDPKPFGVEAGVSVTQDQNGQMNADDFFNDVKDVPVDSVFLLRFNQNFTLLDKTKVTIAGPNGNIKLTCDADSGILYIEPESLTEATDYTMTIGKDSLSGYLGEKLASDITIHFKTNTPPITSLAVTTNTSQAPLEYIFTANAIGGFNPEYKFLINENGVWKVLQDYSSTRSLVWHPRGKGSYDFKVLVRSSGSDLDYEKSYQFTQTVNDDILPTARLIPSLTAYTNQNINITVKASDNVGIKSITLPNREIVNASSTTYTVSKNGSYLFEIEDLMGNVVTKSIVINNIDKTLPVLSLLPSTKAPTKNDLIVVANSTDNVKVKSIKLPNGTIFNGTNAYFPISKNGTYSFTVEDVAGNKVTKSIKVSNIDKTAPASPTVNKVTTKTTVITGKAEKGTTVYIYNGSKYLNKGTADSKGYFRITIKPQKKGSTLKACAVDKANNRSKYTIFSVK